MLCNHCGISFRKEKDNHILLDSDDSGWWHINHIKCPECLKLNIFLILQEGIFSYPNNNVKMWIPHFTAPKNMSVLSERLIHPNSNRSAPNDVPNDIAIDYNESATILYLSSNASAALSRRCLQSMLHAHGIKKNNLHSEIEELLNQKILPPYINNLFLNRLKLIGNIAAHPLRNTITDQVLSVTQDEALWMLDVLDLVFEFWYVTPSKANKILNSYNSKATAGGKLPTP